MSMKLFTRLGGGVVLGSAALLLAAPAAALAASDGGHDPRGSTQGPVSKKSDDTPKTFDVQDKSGNGVTCASNEQVNEQNIAQVIRNNVIVNSVVTFNLGAANAASNSIQQSGNVDNIVVCIRDIDVDVEVKRNLLTDILRMTEAGTSAAASSAGASASAQVGPEGAWVLPSTAAVAAGDGGALDTNTGALTAAGASMMGVGAIGGLALLRRRSANGTVA
ncbi:hypothetical protein GA0074692_1633 [Micromonospora pallida]|uniref:MYXO-CTERM domain-containing protein n=1 Tax=Micromonospora pallida TaxID=145854 RepID=A0A1C6S309_9ACTN|nr:hypothetical protein [Micromonospora pallida]SCL23712.1 hypothetical protein GA0074692_1633 [Micromonospora pallida]